MRHSILSLGVLLLAGALFFGLVPAHDSAAQTGRVIEHRKGIALDRLLKPGDVDVTVVKDQAPPLYIEPPPGISYLEWMTSRTPFVLLIRVRSLSPMLTEEQDWIKTTVHAGVEHILKQPLSEPLSVGDSIQFLQDGGELTLQGTRVRAVLPWADSLTRGNRYIVFAERDEMTGTWRANTALAYEIDSSTQTLRPLVHEGKARAEANVPLSVAISRIETAAKQE